MTQEMDDGSSMEGLARDTLMIFEDALVPSLPSDEEQGLMGMTGLRVLKVTPETTGGARPGVDVSQLRSKLEANLTGAHITTEFSTFILDRFEEQAGSRMLRFTGPDMMRNTCGLRPDDGEFGIFDPERAQDVEREALEMFAQEPYSIPELREQQSEKLAKWRRSFEEKYNQQ